MVVNTPTPVLWLSTLNPVILHPSPWLPRRPLHTPNPLSPVFTGKKTIASG